MDRNRKYSEIDGENDGFTRRSHYDGRNDGNAADDGYAYDDDYDYDDIDTDYGDLEDKWYEIQNDYRGRYTDITDNDAKVEPGRFDRTMDRIGRRRGKSPGEVQDEIENW